MDDLTLGERVNVVVRLQNAGYALNVIRQAHAAATNEEDRDNLARLIRDGEAEIQTLGDRLLQLAAAPVATSEVGN